MKTLTLRMLNRRGNELDLIFTAVLVFAAAFVIIFAYYLTGQINTAFVTKGIPTFALGHTTNALTTFNLSIILVTIAFGIATFISAFMIRSHPVFFVASVLGLIVMVFVTSILSNAFDKLIVSSVLQNTGTTTFYSLFVWVRNLPAIFVIIWIIVGIALYAKWHGSSI